LLQRNAELQVGHKFACRGLLLTLVSQSQAITRPGNELRTLQQLLWRACAHVLPKLTLCAVMKRALCLYSGDAVFETRPRHGLSRVTGVFRGFPHSLQANDVGIQVYYMCSHICFVKSSPEWLNSL
jgi:hypothetical protein